MIFRLLLLGLLLLNLKIDAQSKEKINSIIITGRIVEFNSGEAVALCKVFLNDEMNNIAVCKMDGTFQFEIPSLKFKKSITLTFKSIGFKPLVFKNIPIQGSMIELGTIVLPNYIRYDDFNAKLFVRRRGKFHYSKKRTIQHKNELKEKNLKENEIKFHNYRYFWNENTYKLVIKNNCIDFRKPSKQ